MPPDNPLARMWANKLTAASAPPIDDPPPPPSPTGADYERERDARVARNRAIMQELGINNLAASITVPSRAEPKRKRRTTDASNTAVRRGSAPTSAPTRRSTRSTRHTGPFVDEVNADALRASGLQPRGAQVGAHPRTAVPSHTTTNGNHEDDEEDPEEKETFDDSGVLRYTAWTSTEEGPFSISATDRRDDDAENDADAGQKRSKKRPPLLGFAERPVRFIDGTCKKGFYSIDTTRHGKYSVQTKKIGDESPGAGAMTPSPRPALLAAGGDGGRCAVFALGTRGRRFESHGGRTTNHPHRPMAPSGTDKVEVECDKDDDWETDEETGRRISYKSPLLSWTAHRGWCSQTQFPHHRLPRLASKDDTASRTGTSAGNANTNSYLLTAGGMDGTVCSWDLSVKSNATGAPRLAWRLDAGRGSGVFSMHHWNDELLVGCKDWTVRQWSLPEDAVRGAKVGGSNPPGAKFDAHVREYDDLHRGVVRCVRWNTPDVDDVINDESTMNNSNGLGGALFASCGNDGCVAVVDTRLPTNRAKVAGVDGAHGGRAVNFVEWGRGAGSAFSPGGGIKNTKSLFHSSPTLLTSGADAYVRLWDLRALAAPLDEALHQKSNGQSNAPLEMFREFTGHHRAGTTKPKTITRAVFVFDSADDSVREAESTRSANCGIDLNSGNSDGGGVYVVTPGERSRAVSLYKVRDGSAGNDIRTCVGNEAGDCVSRGEVGFDPTAVFARGSLSDEDAGFGWSLALANKGEVRVYGAVREGGGSAGR